MKSKHRASLELKPIMWQPKFSTTQSNQSGSQSSKSMWPNNNQQNNKIPSMSDWVDALEPPSTTFVWNVAEFHKFKTAAVGEKFGSNKFMMFGATWRLNCYPNGQKEVTTPPLYSPYGDNSDNK